MSFKTFLNEKYIDRTGTYKEWELMLYGNLPLKESILKDIQKPKKVPLSYHITSIDQIKNIQKIQGSKKQISTFTKGATWLAGGAKTYGEVVLEMEGYSVFESSIDMYSKLSRNGYRWLDGEASGSKTLTDWKYNMQKKVVKYLRKRFPKDKHEELMINRDFVGVTAYWKLKEAFKEWSGTEKRDFVKWYFDETKRSIDKKFISTVLDEMYGTIKGTRGEETDSNEVLLQNFKIKRGWYIKHYGEEHPCPTIDCLEEDFGINSCGDVMESHIGYINVAKGKVLKCYKPGKMPY